MGVSSPAPSTMRSLPPFQTKIPPGTALPSTAPPKATAPSRLIAGGPKPANVPPAGAGGCEHNRSVVVETGCRVLAEAGQAADALHAVALARDGANAAARPHEETLLGATAAERGEEHDVAPGVDRCYDRHRLRAETVEDTAARRDIARRHHLAQEHRLAARRRERAHGEQRRQRVHG